MPHIRDLLRIIKRAKQAHSAKTAAAAVECSVPVPVIYSSSQDIASKPSEAPEKKTLKARIKQAIFHNTSRIPRWTGTTKAVVSEEEDAILSQQPPYIPLSISSEDALRVKKNKFALSEVKRCALRMVSRIPRPRRGRPEIGLAKPPLRASDTLAMSSSYEGLGAIITTRVDTNFFNEEDLLAIINPVIEEPEVVVPHYAPITLPRDEPFPFTRRFSYARPNFQRRIFPVDRRFEPSVSTPVEAVKVDDVLEDVCVDELGLVGALSTDEFLQPVRPSEVSDVVPKALIAPQQDVVSIPAAEPAIVTCPILSKSSMFIFAAGSASSSSMSTSDESGAEPLSSATSSPVSLITTLYQSQKAEVVEDTEDLDSDSDDSFNHFKHVHTARTNYPCLESWYDNIINQLKHAKGLDRSSIASSDLVGIKTTPNKDDVNDAIADLDILEVSEDTTCKSDLELSSVAAGALCDPTSLTADSAPRGISLVVNGLRLLGLSAPEGLKTSDFLTLLETAMSVSSASSTSSEEEEKVGPPPTGPARYGAVQGNYTLRGTQPPPPSPLLPTCKEFSFVEEMRPRARRAATYPSTSSHFQGFSGVSPTAHYARHGRGYGSPLISMSNPTTPSSPSPAPTSIPRPHRLPIISAEPTAWEASPRAREHQAALAVAVSSQARPGVRHASLPDFITTLSACSTPPTSHIYDIHISPTLYPSVSGTPRPSMIPRHVSLQRREWASAARLAEFVLPSVDQVPSRSRSRPSMIPRHASLRPGGEWTGAGMGFGLVVPPSFSPAPRRFLRRAVPVPF